MQKPPLIFVWLGNIIPNWSLISLKLALNNSNTTIIILTDWRYANYPKGVLVFYIEEFYK